MFGSLPSMAKSELTYPDTPVVFIGKNGLQKREEWSGLNQILGLPYYFVNGICFFFAFSLS